MNEKMKTVLIFSGGLDSTVLLKQLLQTREVFALSINYGQRHRRELVAATAIAQELGVVHRIVDLTGLTPLLGGSSQTDATVPVPHGHYAEESMKKTIVPNRNMLMLAVAGAWAISLKADELAYAAHAGDHAIYPDCREDFCKPMEDALFNADWHHVRLMRPFVHLTKADVVALGWKIEAPMAMTYSCYEGREVHCGRCGTCTERREAFALAQINDPTVYQS